MATTNKAGSAGQAAALPDALPFKQRPALHKPFQWADPNACEELPAFAPVTFFNRARDITAGCATILELLEQDDLSEDSATDGERPMLSISSRSELMRMTIAALSLLSEDAAARIDWVHKTAKRQSCGQRRQKGGT